MGTDEATEVNQYSLCSYYAEIYFNEIKLSSGTCFFTKRNERVYVITNWHIASGRDADTKVALDKMGSIPNKLRIFVPVDCKDGTCYYDVSSFVDVSLRDEDDQPLWYEMTVGDRTVDVVAIPLENTEFCFSLIESGEEPFNKNTGIEITSEIYIVGFPFGNDYGYTPIWKKGSVASEPNIQMEGLPYFFADTATKQGMSGSPVVMYQRRPMTIVSESEGKFSRNMTKLVGIYSGRIGAYSESRNDAQLGRVWHASVIDEIIALNERE